MVIGEIKKAVFLRFRIRQHQEPSVVFHHPGGHVGDKRGVAFGECQNAIVFAFLSVLSAILEAELDFAFGVFRRSPKRLHPEVKFDPASRRDMTEVETGGGRFFQRSVFGRDSPFRCAEFVLGGIRMNVEGP